MPNSTTNKELLEIILHQTKENAKQQFEFSCKVSTFMNEQNLFNKEVKGYLESNDKTNQKGVVEQVDINKSDIKSIKTDILTDKKVEKAKQTIIGVVVGAILTFISKIFF